MFHIQLRSDTSYKLMAHNTELGKAGETAACGFLTSQGYTILERNYRAGHNEST